WRVREAGERHQPARGLRDDVVRRAARPRPRLPEPREARDDQARMLAHEVGGCEPPPRERSAREVLDQDVDVREKATYERAALGVSDIERDALLVPVEGQERDRHVARRGISVAALV